jgi:hypothetical protein
MAGRSSKEESLMFFSDEDFEQALAGPWSVNAKSLAFSVNTFGLKEMAKLANSQLLKTVTSLNFLYVNIGPDEIEELARSPYLNNLLSLQMLRVHGDGIKVLSSSPTFKTLKSLELKGSWPKKEGLGELVNSPYLTELRSLELVGNELGIEELTVLLPSPLMRRLKSLNLSNNKLGGVGTAVLASTRNAAGLRKLWLNAVNMTREGAEALAASPHLAGLQELHVWSNQLGAEGAKALAESRHLRKLKCFELAANDIQDEGAVFLANSPVFDQVAKLVLSYNRIGDQGAVAIAESCNLPSLVEVDLSNNKIGNAGARAFATSNLLSQLTKISLSRNPIPSEGYRALQLAEATFGYLDVDVDKPASTSKPRIVKSLEPWLKRHQRWAWKPIIRKGDGPTVASKFGGAPWLGDQESWPLCGHCNGPMHLFVQINLEKLPSDLLGKYGHGLLQFFHCLQDDCLYGKYCQDPFTPCMLVRVVEPSETDRLPQIPKYNDRPGFSPRMITGWKKVADFPGAAEFPELGLTYENGKLECAELDFVDENVAIEDFLRLHRCLAGDKLGGWPNWVQVHTSYPKCPRCMNRMDTVVFQVGADDNIPFMFADGGYGPILQCPVHMDVLGFSWDSG